MNLEINLEVSERAGSAIFRNFPNSEEAEGTMGLVFPLPLTLAFEEEEAWNFGPRPLTAAITTLLPPLAAILPLF